KKECLEHPNYVFNTPREVALLEAELQQPLGGILFSHEERYRCRVKGVREFWEDPNPEIQYTLQALKDLTGAEDKEEVHQRLAGLEVVDLRGYPEIHDLSPLTSLTINTTQVYLPEGAKVRSLWGLQSMRELPKVFDAPQVTILGTRPEDCPTAEYVSINNVIQVWYPPSVVSFCKRLHALN
ncbi:MAG: hypothetical protein OXT67_06220, partial [Zetaproteobacteria bacterium]|nr:hypothetical protein [Zetaproteobacteria bacterium]